MKAPIQRRNERILWITLNPWRKTWEILFILADSLEKSNGEALQGAGVIMETLERICGSLRA